MSTPVPSSGTDSSRRSLFLSLRLWSALACILLAATVLLLPVPFGARAFILGVLLFSGVFLVVDAGGKGKTFAALTVALLGLYLLFTAQRGVMLIVSGNIAGTVLGVGLLLLPAVGAWALAAACTSGSSEAVVAAAIFSSARVAHANGDAGCANTTDSVMGVGTRSSGNLIGGGASMSLNCVIILLFDGSKSRVHHTQNGTGHAEPPAEITQ